MREIKFRAWDKNTKRFAIKGDLFILSGFMTGYHEKGNDLRNLSFQEYTGLTDRNGTPIYEGDIVKFASFGGVYEVKYEYASFYPFEAANAENCVVIGNIYENKDLLK